LTGFAADSPTSELAAKCSTASMLHSASTLAARTRIAPRTNAAPGGTASWYLVDKSSRTVT
jgi:hypothetical protein